MSDRDGGGWVPIAAGVIVGAGILTLLYKMLFAEKCYKQVNQQIGVPFKCTCKDARNMPSNIFSAEELERRRRECQDIDGTGGAGASADGSGGGIWSIFGSGDDAWWLPLMGYSALLALLGTIGAWLYGRKSSSLKCRKPIKNLTAIKNNSECEVKINPKRRKWPIEENKKDHCDCSNKK